jgi:polar amino acid transport system permease protein
MDGFAATFLNLEIIRAAWPILMAGLWMSVKLTLVAVPLGLLGGLSCALLHLSSRRAVRWAVIAYVDFFRAFPPLVLLILLYAGLPFAGIELSAFACVAIGFLLNASSYYGEIFRAGIESIPAGQRDAAYALGLGWGRTMRLVILPQAVRNVLPDLVGNTLEVIKLTSIASVVALPELLYQARQAQSVTYNASPIVAAAVIYFVLLWPMVRLLSRLEHAAIGAR